MKLLVVEDEPKLARSLESSLQRAGYTVDLALDGEAALDHAEVYEYDLVVLDVMLPKVDGFQVLKRLRNRRIRAPILMLTAREDTESKVRGLDFGADDYVVKPFELEELLARIRALLRRDGSDRSALLHTGAGIPLSERERIFRRFYRADPCRSRGTGGAGLGLAIVSRIVNFHRGRVSVESDPGKGSSFFVQLPLSESAGSDEAESRRGSVLSAESDP